MDKFRKQPTRIHEPNLEWQACHKIFYQWIEVNDRDPDELIAKRFLEFSFSEFVEALPSVYHLDGHFHPQHWTRELLWREKRFPLYPPCHIIPIEDKNGLDQIPGLNLETRTNPTGHIKRDFTVSDQNLEVIRRLYRRDYQIGNYPAFD